MTTPFQVSLDTKDIKMNTKFIVLLTILTLLTVTEKSEANNLVAYYTAAASTVLIAAAAVIFKVASFPGNRQGRKIISGIGVRSHWIAILGHQFVDHLTGGLWVRTTNTDNFN